ncbi:hypothetical protein BT63DRAFT_460275 [Microthyrium microscopicum]|uniref:Uncharacterized protein n=1 Tax=Microthyrium microscopicum TaxID=703497 RepID=A0A6A6TXH3_9PEZI|nr:hypothetical protein BT63DRAFT_460275 [Microthyrium microscopicum]
MSRPLEKSIPTLLANLTQSLESAVEAAPAKAGVLPPAEDLSLLTTKNEIFLSYIQNLVFLIVVKLRHTSLQWNGDENLEETAKLNTEVVEKLAELRLYLEKGIKPLEGKLKYQIDKVIRAAEDASRPQATNGSAKIGSSKVKGGKPVRSTRRDADFSGSDASGGGSGNDSDDSEDMEDLYAAPNQNALLRAGTEDKKESQRKDGIYRPPKITPTSLPVTFGKEAKAERKPKKAAALDEFIATELSSAPMAEPSIGSTIRSGGRHTLSQREREQEAERRKYEEENFTRLPKPSKTDRAQSKRSHNTFGGEEWRNLGQGLDRIEKLTKRSSNSANLLARSRKREVQDGPRDSGQQPGSTFAKRRKT